MTLPAVGVSSCLLGEPVRYDGGHKRQPFLTDILSRFVRMVPVCPEVESGMPVPRDPMHLEENSATPRLVARSGGRDLTEQMHRYLEMRVPLLAREELSGFLLKGRSPSCGIGRIPVFCKGTTVVEGRGLFADALINRFPSLPVAEEEIFSDGLRLDHFLVRVFAGRRWLDFLAGEPSPAVLTRFHGAHKYLLMAHDPALCREMGSLAAARSGASGLELLRRYGGLLAEALSHPASRAKHVNVLMHLAGYFKHLDGKEREDFHRAIDSYGRGAVSLELPLSLLKEQSSMHRRNYLLQQCYFEPYPAALKRHVARL